MKTTLRAILVAAGLLLGAAASAAPASFALPHAARLEITVGDRPGARLRSASRNSALTLDASLRRLIGRSTVLIPASNSGFVLDTRPATVLYVRVPSNPSRPTGYCGAGTEDYLALLTIEDNRVILLDRLLVQSCLDTLELGGELDAPSGNATTLRFPWVARLPGSALEATQARCVRVAQDRLVVDDCNRMDVSQKP